MESAIRLWAPLKASQAEADGAAFGLKVRAIHKASAGGILAISADAFLRRFDLDEVDGAFQPKVLLGYS